MSLKEKVLTVKTSGHFKMYFSLQKVTHTKKNKQGITACYIYLFRMVKQKSKPQHLYADILKRWTQHA